MTNHKDHIETDPALFRALINRSNDAIFIIDLKNGVLIFVNDKACSSLGYTRQELLKLNVIDAEAVSTDNFSWHTHLDELRQSGSVILEGIHKRKDGTLFPVEVNVSYVLMNTREYAVVIVRDITELKRNERILQARLGLSEYAASHSLEELLQKTVDETEHLTGSRIGFLHFIEDEQQTIWLQVWSTNTTKSMCTAEGKGIHYSIEKAGVWTDCVHERRPVIHNDYAGLQHRKGMPEGHAPVVRELVVPVLRGNSIVAILGVGNKPQDYDEYDVTLTSELANMAWDIVLQKRADEAFRESEQRYRQLFNSIRDAIVIADKDRTIIDVNPAFTALFGYTFNEIVGKKTSFIMAIQEEFADLGRSVEQYSGSESLIYLAEYKKKNGETFPGEASISFFTDNSGKSLGYIGLVKDISDRKRTEEDIKRLNEDLEIRIVERTAELEAINRKLQDEIAERKSAEDMLLETTQRYQLATDSGQLGIWDWDIGADKMVWNDRMLELYGISREAFTEDVQAWERGLNPDDRTKALADVQSAINGEKKFDTEFRVKRPDGSVRTLKANAIVIRNAEGKAVRMLGLNRDITQLKEAEEKLSNAYAELEARVHERTAELTAANAALKSEIAERKTIEEALVKSEKEFRLLAEAMPQIVWVTRADGWNIYYNQHWVDYTGLSMEESYGHGWNKPFHPDDRQRAWDAWRDAVTNKHIYSLECRLRRVDGMYRWWLIRGVPVLDAKGEVLKWFGTCTDIDEIKHAEATLRKRERQLTDSQHVARLGSWDLNLVTQELEWSDETYRLFDQSPENFIPSFDIFARMVHPDDRETMQTNFDRALVDDASPYHVAVRITNESGRQWVMEAFGAVRRDGNGKALSIYGTAQDITEHKHAEDRINQSLKEKETLLKEIHHRVKNNLQIVSSMLQLQSRYIKDKESKILFEESQKRVESMSLIHEKLYRSRDLSGIDFREYVVDLTHNLLTLNTAKSGQIEIELHIEGIILDINNAIPCGLIVNELVSNALVHAFPDDRKGKIEVSMHSSGDRRIRLSVRDNGIGFPEDLDFKNTASLGMQLVNSLVTQLDGSIELDRNDGTTFMVEFQK